jgi:hypothetical protein
MISAFNITPSYYAGHLFTWQVPATFAEARPWVFSIEVSPDGLSEWTTVIGNLVNIFAWQQPDKPGKTDLDLDPFYRVVMTTGADHTYESGAKGCYGDLPKRDYLIAKEMMRKELLMLRKSSGVICELWKKMKTGIKCTYCTDPVTGETNSTKCPYCLGAKYEGGYTGPYEVWAEFSLRKSSKQHDAGGFGLTDAQPVQIKLIGHPFVNSEDVVVDRDADRRYAVQAISSTVEVRRVPILTTTSANELTMTDMAYKLGKSDRADDTCGNDRSY